MSRLLVGPFNRVEGDLEVQLDIADGRVTSAQVNATMYRGFEQILQGKVLYKPTPAEAGVGKKRGAKAKGEKKRASS